MGNKVCKCGKGYVSHWDNKCGHCRTKKEQWDHQKAMADLPEFCTDVNATYRFLRWGK